MRSLGRLLNDAKREQRPVLMGVLNLTPNSFFDGGKYLDPSVALARVDALIAEGAEILDLGAESSKPGAEEVSADEQLRRLQPVLPHALARGVVVSVDTTSPEVASRVLSEGVQLINDVSCLRHPGLAEAVARKGAWLAITHSRKPMSEMTGFSQWPDDDYPNIVEDVAQEWGQARRTAVELGVKADQIVFDPGLGFSKNARHSYILLGQLRRFRTLGAPILVGPGRKSFLAASDGAEPAKRLGGTVAASLLATLEGADVLRVHDAFETRQALAVLACTRNPNRAIAQETPGEAAPPSSEEQP